MNERRKYEKKKKLFLLHKKAAVAAKLASSKDRSSEVCVNYLELSREILIKNLAMNKLDIYARNESEYLVNTTSCLPRIIKPRKRRKKERKSSNSAPTEEEDFSSSATFTFSLENEFTPSFTIDDWRDKKTLNFNSILNKNEENDLLFLNRLNESSSLLSLSSGSGASSQFSTSVSSCSCQLCAPNCKIWSFPLQKSSSYQESSFDDRFIGEQVLTSVTKKKDFGIIGSDRLKEKK